MRGDSVSGFPSVSIIMPVRNEAETIDATLDSVVAQDYEGPLEIVVAVAPSDDDTRERVEQRSASDRRFTVVDNPAGHAAGGLNAAIAAATGSVLVRCDGHAVLEPDYVRTAVTILSETGAANVGGVQAATGTGLWQRAIALAMTSPLGVGNARFHYGSTPGAADTVYLGVFDRTAIEAVGGFDESLLRNQDYELNHRLRRAGHVVWFDPRLRVEYRPRSTPGALWRQYFDYGTWKRRMLRASPEALKARQLAPPLLAIGLAGSSVALAGGQPLGWVIPLAYAGFLLIGSLTELLRRRRREATLRLRPDHAVRSAPKGRFLVARPKALRCSSRCQRWPK